jgi:phosphoribosyl-AMP cyclohydrolase
VSGRLAAGAIASDVVSRGVLAVACGIVEHPDVARLSTVHWRRRGAVVSPIRGSDDAGDSSSPEGLRSAAGVDTVRFGADGLIATVVQDAHSGEVLMLAWMNRPALEQSLATGTTVFYSRSRQELWPKGATSGNVQRIVSIATDCDRDALLVRVDQTGVACHTGQRSCFHVGLAADPHTETAP